MFIKNEQRQKNEQNDGYNHKPQGKYRTANTSLTHPGAKKWRLMQKIFSHFVVRYNQKAYICQTIRVLVTRIIEYKSQKF